MWISFVRLCLLGLLLHGAVGCSYFFRFDEIKYSIESLGSASERLIFENGINLLNNQEYEEFWHKLKSDEVILFRSEKVEASDLGLIWLMYALYFIDYGNSSRDMEKGIAYLILASQNPSFYAALAKRFLNDVLLFEKKDIDIRNLKIKIAQKDNYIRRQEGVVKDCWSSVKKLKEELNTLKRLDEKQRLVDKGEGT